MSTISERLIDLRKNLSLTQSEFAKTINRTQGTYSAYEVGTANVPNRTIIDICEAFNVNEQWLRQGIGPMFRPKKTDESALAEEAALLIKSNDPLRIKVATGFLKMLREKNPLVDSFKEYVRDFNDSLTENK